MTENSACLCAGKIKPCGRCRLIELARARAEAQTGKQASAEPGRWPGAPPRRQGS